MSIPPHKLRVSTMFSLLILARGYPAVTHVWKLPLKRYKPVQRVKNSLYSPSQKRWRAQIFRGLQDSQQPAISAGTTAVSKSVPKPIMIVCITGPMWIVQKFCKGKLVWWSKIWFVINLWLMSEKITIFNVSGILRSVFRLLETSSFDNYFNL